MNQAQKDKKLIDKAKEDISNFTPLYKKYRKAVFRYVYNRVSRKKELAEDITSETFVKAIDNFDSFKFRNKPFVVWLYTIAHNLIVDYFRSKKERNISLDNLPIPPKDISEDQILKLSREELKEQIKQVSPKLSDELNNIFTLKHTEDLTFSEIAQLIGKTEGAVKMQYYRGLEKLKDLIENR